MGQESTHCREFVEGALLVGQGDFLLALLVQQEALARRSEPLEEMKPLERGISWAVPGVWKPRVSGKSASAVRIDG